MPDQIVDLGKGKGCGKCCSRYCRCPERYADGQWAPDNCDYCLNNIKAARTDNNTYAVNP